MLLNKKKQDLLPLMAIWKMQLELLLNKYKLLGTELQFDPSGIQLLCVNWLVYNMSSDLGSDVSCNCYE